MTMLEDGVKAAGKDESVDVLDVAEIIANALSGAPAPRPTKATPSTEEARET
jgi:hypothetical protein